MQSQEQLCYFVCMCEFFTVPAPAKQSVTVKHFHRAWLQLSCHVQEFLYHKNISRFAMTRHKISTSQRNQRAVHMPYKWSKCFCLFTLTSNSRGLVTQHQYNVK